VASTQDDGFVVFEHVQKSYDGETLVVKDLNLTIGQGEFLISAHWQAPPLWRRWLRRDRRRPM
jgi:hypothetical protein